MTPLIVVLPYCAKDSEQAERLLNWIHEIGGGQCALLCADAGVPQDTKVRLNLLAKQSFVHSETMIATVPETTNYHVAAAQMFAAAARQVSECYKWPWLWLEPDCVPLKKGWLEELTLAYETSPKQFMGALINVNQPGVPPSHMAGVGIYPNNAYDALKKYCDGSNHFDMAMAGYVVPRAVNTSLLWHRWGTPSEVPTFKAQKLATDGPNVGTLEMIPREAVLFHRTKDSGLIDLLRTKPDPDKNFLDYGNSPEQLVEEVLAQPDPPKKRMGRPPKIREPISA